jgi:hypothetical protein
VADSFQQQIYEPKQSDYFNLNEKAFREILSRGSLGKTEFEDVTEANEQFAKHNC